MSTVYFRIAARGPIIHTRAPALERVLARAEAGGSAADWRCEAFRVIAGGSSVVPAVATSALRAVREGAGGAWVCVATPVHLVAGMSSLSMPSDGILDLGPAQADALAAGFNCVFGDGGVRLVRGGGSLLLCLFDTRLEVATSAPEELTDGEIWGALPRGADSKRLLRLMSEIEMWLFEHPLNEDRRARGLRAISGLWLWGGGDIDAPQPEVPGWTAGVDPFFSSFAPQPRYPDHPGAGVVVIAHWPGTPEWGAVEDGWLTPAFADLKSGGLSRIELSVRDRTLFWRAKSLRRFWRKIRPWWEVLNVGEPLR